MNHFKREAWIMWFFGIGLAVIAMLLVLLMPLINWIRDLFR
jgi:hypothetical protein